MPTMARCARCHAMLAADGACQRCRQHQLGGIDLTEGASSAQTLFGWHALSTDPDPARRRERATAAGREAVRRLRRAGLKPSGRPAGDPPGIGSRAKAMEVTSLTKVYGAAGLEITAVRDASFEVTAGEVVLIMGPSGSGKTTLLLMLGAMLRPTSGSVIIGGTDVTVTPEGKLPALRASHLGFVFQDFNLLSALTALENVAIACNLAGVRGEAAAARACSLLDRVGLWRKINSRPAQLSGGEKQRVAVARALANDPPLLLADEPTANLDSVNGREIGALLRRLADEDGRTSLIVTHDERLSCIADRVLWLEDGVLG